MAGSGRRQGLSDDKTWQMAGPGRRLGVADGRTWQTTGPGRRQDLADDTTYQTQRLINQLKRFRFDPLIAFLENNDTAIVGDW